MAINLSGLAQSLSNSVATTSIGRSAAAAAPYVSSGNSAGYASAAAAGAGLQSGSVTLSYPSSTSAKPNYSSWGYDAFAPSSSGGAAAIAAPVEFPYATIGNLYGVNSATAYKEALQNTAVMRQMEDFKRAGLNPVLAARYGGADSNIDDVGFQAPVSVTAVGSGSGGGYSSYSGGSSSGSTSAKNTTLSTLGKAAVAVASNRNALQTVASLASAGTFAATKSFQLGAAAYYGVQAAGNAISNIFKK